MGASRRGPRTPGKGRGERKSEVARGPNPAPGSAAERSQPARPLLFLDVDGVVNALDRSLDVETIEREGFRIRIQPWLRGCLADLHRHFEVVWMTTWREKAEPCFAEVLGLPGQRAYVPWSQFKLPALVMYAAGRPWAFVDDDAEWEVQQLRWSGSSGGLIIVPDPDVGLTREQTDTLVAWAEAL